MEADIDEWAVTTWNLQGTKATDLGRVSEVIRDLGPDVVAIQEVRKSQAAELGATLGMRFTWSFKHHALAPLAMDRAEGAAILTPHALAAAGHTVVSQVQSRRSYKRRIVQWALVGRRDGTAYRVYNVHLSPHARPERRRLEAITIAGIVVEHGDPAPVIVAGDLNDDEEPDVAATLPGIEHIASPPTNPSSVPTKHLDHVLLPPEVRAVSVSAPGGGPDWESLSDHLPLTVRFTPGPAG